MKKIAVIVIIALCITACELEGGGGGGGSEGIDVNNGSLTISGTAVVYLNGEIKKWATVDVYGDSGFKIRLGSTFMYNSTGTLGLNDSEHPTIPATPDGTWRINIRPWVKITSPFRRIWIVIGSDTYGMLHQIIEYPVNLYDKSVSGIDLGKVDLKGDIINFTVGNNFTAYNGASVDHSLSIYMYVQVALASFDIKPIPSSAKPYTFVTRTVDDSEIIVIIVGGYYFNPEIQYGGTKRIEITGAQLKSGYTLNNIVLEYY